MPAIDSGKVSLHYRWAGAEDGPVLVLSHSLGSSSVLWGSQIATLGAKFRLLLYDHRGHGESGAPPSPWRIDDFGNDVIRLLDELKLERVRFCGISLGGMVGMWLAQRAPDRLDRLVIANTSAFTENPALLRGRMELIEREGLESIVENVLERWFTSGFRAKNSETVEIFRKQLLATPAASYLATSAAICELDLRPGLAGISTPMLVITGDNDQATPPAWGEAIAAATPGSKLRNLDAAHLSNVEAAEAFDAAVHEFFDWPQQGTEDAKISF